MDDPAARHAARAEHHLSQRPVVCAVLTVSDTRTPATDASGSLAAKLLREAGHALFDRTIVTDEPGEIASQLDRWLTEPSVQAVLITGGTGIAPRDVTVDVVRPQLDIELEGFGELFRWLSFEQISGAAMLSRAVAGLVIRDATRGGETLVFVMPGSPKAVELAMSRLIIPQLRHLIWMRTHPTKSPLTPGEVGERCEPGEGGLRQPSAELGERSEAG